MKTISEILADVVANMTIVELQDALQKCLRNGHTTGAWALQQEIDRRVARNERLAAVLAANPVN